MLVSFARRGGLSYMPNGADVRDEGSNENRLDCRMFGYYEGPTVSPIFAKLARPEMPRLLEKMLLSSC